MPEYDQVERHDLVLPIRIPGIDSVPLNDTCDAISNDTDYSTTVRILCTFHSCSLLFSLVFVDHPNDEFEYAFVNDCFEGIPSRIYRKQFVLQLYSHNELIVHDHHAFHLTEN